jgi:hypothetical protein
MQKRIGIETTGDETKIYRRETNANALAARGAFGYFGLCAFIVCPLKSAFDLDRVADPPNEF